MKIGDIGFGKTRKRVYKGSQADGGWWCKLIAGLVLAAVVGYMVFTEYMTYKKFVTLKLVKSNAVVLAPGQSGVETLNAAGSMYDGKIVFLEGVGARTDGMLRDNDFQLDFPDAGNVQRVCEYCQWQEHSSTSRTQIGEDDDGKAIYEEETTYYYTKDWRNHKVSSIFFDSPIAYNNPQRDPFPSYSHDIGAVIGGSKTVKGGLLKLRDAVVATIPHDLEVTDYALNHGVDSHDGRHIYSVYERTTTGSFLQSLGGFFIDGVIDLGLSGKCEPGDIRVSFNVRRLFPSYSLAGRVTGQEIVPFKLGSGTEILISAGGAKTLPEVIEEYSRDLKNDLWIIRGIAILVGIVFTLVFALVKTKAQKKLKTA